MRRTFLSVLISAMFCGAGHSIAEENAPAPEQPAPEAEAPKSRFSFSGFGTLGVVRTDTDLGDYTADGFQDNGATDKADFGFGSNIGVQATYHLTDSLSGVGQVVAKRRVTEFKPDLEWLFLKWQPNEDWALRLGRLVAPIFSVSDYRQVNFANIWVRPPLDVYSQVPFTSLDGADVTYHKSIGENIFTGQLTFGQSEVDQSADTQIKDEDILAINLFWERGPFTLRAAWGRGDLSVKGVDPFAPLVSGIRAAAAFPPSGATTALADAFDLKDKEAVFTALSFNVDYKDFLLQGEIGKRRIEGLALPDTTAWQITGGYRLGKFTPYVFFSQAEIDSPTSDSSIQPLTPQLAALGGFVNAVLGVNGVSTTGVGLRYDLSTTMAVKVQYEQTKRDGPFAGRPFGTFTTAPTAVFEDKVNILSVSLDFVF